MKLTLLTLFTPVLSHILPRADPVPTTHKVLVGHPVREKSLAFVPPSLKAAVGDTVQFQFRPFNHTVTQSVGPAAPCGPMGSSSIINSGFVPGAAEAEKEVPVFEVRVASAETMYLYCGQPPHCNLGMVMVINPKSDDDLAALTAAAKAQQQTVPPAGAMAGGTLASIPASEAMVPP